MKFDPLPFQSTLYRYEAQARELLDARDAGDADAIRIFHQNHPRFLDEKIVWLPKRIPDSEIANAKLDLSDAQLALSRLYNFRDWASLVQYVNAVLNDSEVARFESAVEAVINGDAAGLRQLLRDHPQLVRARSSRVLNFDPPMHRATLLHYVAANGVEGYRQKTPDNAVEIAKILLQAGAEPDALANMYGGECTTMSMLVSSSHPAKKGVQVALAETLIDFGAAVGPRGSGNWASPVNTALVFGFVDAAEALVRRGARVDQIETAAGLGRADDVRRMLSSSGSLSRHRALALASQLGREDAVRVLLDAGEDPNRFNPDGMHAHATPLHQAALGGHEAVVRLLVERGARLDIKDQIFQGTPLGWAEYGGQAAIAGYLRAAAG